VRDLSLTSDAMPVWVEDQV